jgi:hypothetical protein
MSDACTWMKIIDWDLVKAIEDNLVTNYPVGMNERDKLGVYLKLSPE